jgi:uncharacterized protein YbjQ (UPF0145 family)
MKICPRCGTENPDHAVTCECLHDFTKLNRLPVTTTSEIEGRPVRELLGIVAAEYVVAFNSIQGALVELRDGVGGRSGTLQSALKEGRIQCINEVKREAHDLGADAVLGLSLSVNDISGGGRMMLMLVGIGTAVRLEELSREAI